MKQAFITSFLLFALAGCNAAPVRVIDYENQPINRSGDHGISMEEVQIDVRMAAAKTGWIVVSNELPGRMIATKTDGNTSATVEIVFNLNRYSIKYKDSTNLDQLNGCTSKTPAGLVKIEGKCISPTYNEWVTELKDQISSLQY